MKTRLSLALAICLSLFLTACATSPQSMIVGKWEVQGAPIKMTAQFNSDGTAAVTMMGQTVRGTYKLNGDNELEWTVGGTTTRSKVNVTATELELTDNANRTIKYKRV